MVGNEAEHRIDVLLAKGHLQKLEYLSCYTAVGVVRSIIYRQGL
jgi:hypothetical protein